LANQGIDETKQKLERELFAMQEQIKAMAPKPPAPSVMIPRSEITLQSNFSVHSLKPLSQPAVINETLREPLFEEEKVLREVALKKAHKNI
jgi:hypothetical protein